MIPMVYAETTITAANGSGSPGCEKTNECYSPYTAYVDVGETVIFSNPDNAAHTFTSGHPGDGPTGLFDTGLMMAGNSFEYTPDTVGKIDYFCMVHPWMIGMIIVGSGGTTPTVPIPEPTPETHQDDRLLKIENQKLKEQVSNLKLENKQLKNQINSLNSEIDSLKDQIISMSGEFVKMITQLNEWFRSQLS